MGRRGDAPSHLRSRQPGTARSTIRACSSASRRWRRSPDCSPVSPRRSRPGGRTLRRSLKAGAREGTVHRSRLRVALLVTQAALSVVLLVGAGLFVRSLRNVQNIRLGYDTEQVLWVKLEDRGVKMDSIEKVALREQLLQRAQSLAGVEQASSRADGSVLVHVGILSLRRWYRFGDQARRFHDSSRIAVVLRNDGHATDSWSRHHRRGSQQHAARNGRERGNGQASLAERGRDRQVRARERGHGAVHRRRRNRRGRSSRQLERTGVPLLHADRAVRARTGRHLRENAAVRRQRRSSRSVARCSS